MVRPGICSVTLAKHSPREVLQTAVEAGLQGIEWWGRDHVPHGDVATATTVGDQTREAGLEVACYGSYYRVGSSENKGLSFLSVLDTATALGASMIRVWAGNQDGIDADAAHVQAVIDDTLRIADLAAARDTSVVFEYHGGSLTDRNETVRPLNYPEDFHRHPLADGKARWRAYFDAAQTTGRDHYALLEFVKNDSPEQVVQDAAVLKGLTGSSPG